MSDSVVGGDQQQSLQTEMKERAELISVLLTTVLEEEGYASAVDQARKLFTHTTPAQMEQMKPHFSSLALEFMILAGFFKDRPSEALHLAGIGTPLRSRENG
jgi:hypothetical protein